MKIFKCSVLRDDEMSENHYRVLASTMEDAQQLAFALDGGWCAIARDATEMLALAQAHTEAIEES